MRTLEAHVDRIVGLTNDQQRADYLRAAPELKSDEGARVLCRHAVALLYCNVNYARSLCRFLAVIARARPTPLTSAYRDHAWGAAYFTGGLDYRKALVRWKRAVRYLEQAGRSDEAAITRLSALPTLACLDQLDLFAEWVNSAQATFETNGDRLRLARLRSNTAFLYFRRCEWSLAAETFELAYNELIGAGASNKDIFVSLTSLATCYVNLGDIPRATNLVDKARIVCEDGGLSSASDQLDELIAYINYLRGDLGAALRVAREAHHHASRQRMRHSSSENALTEVSHSTVPGSPTGGRAMCR